MENDDESTKEIKVLDLTTNEYVYDGPLVENTKTGKDGVIYMYNVITGEIYQTKKFLNKLGDYELTSFSKETGLKEYVINKTKGHRIVQYYDERGVLEQEVTIKNNSRRFKNYDKDGKTPLEIY